MRHDDEVEDLVQITLIAGQEQVRLERVITRVEFDRGGRSLQQIEGFIQVACLAKRAHIVKEGGLSVEAVQVDLEELRLIDGAAAPLFALRGHCPQDRDRLERLATLTQQRDDGRERCRGEPLVLSQVREQPVELLFMTAHEVHLRDRLHQAPLLIERHHVERFDEDLVGRLHLPHPDVGVKKAPRRLAPHGHVVATLLGRGVEHHPQVGYPTLWKAVMNQCLAQPELQLARGTRAVEQGA